MKIHHFKPKNSKDCISTCATITNFTMNRAKESNNFSEEISESSESWINAWYQSIISTILDIDFTYWLGWLLTPIALAFLLPIVLLILIYVSAFIAFAYRVGLFRRLREAAAERDIYKAAREVIALMWVAFGSIWYGYEANGWENIPDEGPALIVYYHGAVPIDYYQLVAHCILKKRRVIHSVVDTFLFKIPGLKTILSAFCCTPGTVASCADDLRAGNLLGLAPGGVYEAQFSDSCYKLEWKSRVGFAKIAIEAKVPVIPVFTQNVREAFRTVGLFRSFMVRVYNRLRFPCTPLYGGFPVKLRTIIGTPIPFDKEDTPFTLRQKCKDAIENLIKEHQRVPGSIFCALLERLPLRGTKCKSKEKEKIVQNSRKNSIDPKIIQPLLKTHSS